MATERRISSRATVLSKFVLPGLWLALLGAAALWLLLGASELARQLRLSLGSIDVEWALLGSLPLGLMTYAMLSGVSLKEVRLAEDTLTISGYRKRIVVRLADVMEVKQTYWTRGVVRLCFRQPTAFGSEITFIPATPRSYGFWADWPLRDPWSRTIWGWKPDPIVEELTEAARACRWRDAAPPGVEEAGLARGA